MCVHVRGGARTYVRVRVRACERARVRVRLGVRMGVRTRAALRGCLAHVRALLNKLNGGRQWLPGINVPRPRPLHILPGACPIMMAEFKSLLIIMTPTQPTTGNQQRSPIPPHPQT